MPEHIASMDGNDDSVTVRIKQSAITANESVADYVDQFDHVVTFDSRDAADECAHRLSATGGTTVAVQRAAPQDGDTVDAYLVAQPDRRTHSPDGSIDTGLTFDTTANQYGAIGETLLVEPDSNPPVLTYYARQELDIATNDQIHVEIDDAPSPVTATRDGAPLEWRPDCSAVVRDSSDGRMLCEYLCEIKTGNGSLAREQHTVMRTAARYTSVLKIQVDIRELPDSYTARIREVSPAEEADVVIDVETTVNARLDEF